MRLTDLAGQDPDHLPYRVFTPLGDPVAVHFEPLTAADTPELNGPRWQGARFLPMWQQNTSSDAALKLVIGKSQSKEIEGIIKPGEVTAGNSALRNSIIEAAPVNQVKVANRFLLKVENADAVLAAATEGATQ